MQYVSGDDDDDDYDDVDEFQVVFGQLTSDNSYEFNEFTLHFMHQDSFEIPNDKLR